MPGSRSLAVNFSHKAIALSMPWPAPGEALSHSIGAESLCSATIDTTPGGDNISILK